MNDWLKEDNDRPEASDYLATKNNPTAEVTEAPPPDTKTTGESHDI